MVIEAPAWGLLSIGFLFTFAFMWAFDPLWRATIGAAFKRLAGIGIGGIRGVGAVHPFSFLGTVNTHVETWIENGKKASERGLAYSFAQLIDAAALLIGVPLAIALALYELAQYVVHVAPHAITHTVHETVTKPITKVVRVTAEVTKAQFNHLTRRVDVLAHRVANVAHVGAGAIAAPFPRIGSLEKKIANQGARLKKVEKALALGASAALVWTALRRLGLSWLRCSNVRKTGRAVCGMNPLTLEALLLDAAALTVTFNLEEFARELQTVTGEAARLIHNFAD